jgi:hypothetical protein
MTTGKRPSQVDITNSWQETIMVRVVSAEFGILDASDFSANRGKTSWRLVAKAHDGFLQDDRLRLCLGPALYHKQICTSMNKL